MTPSSPKRQNSPTYIVKQLTVWSNMCSKVTMEPCSPMDKRDAARPTLWWDNQTTKPFRGSFLDVLDMCSSRLAIPSRRNFYWGAPSCRSTTNKSMIYWATRVPKCSWRKVHKRGSLWRTSLRNKQKRNRNSCNFWTRATKTELLERQPWTKIHHDRIFCLPSSCNLHTGRKMIESMLPVVSIWWIWPAAKGSARREQQEIGLNRHRRSTSR